MCLGDWNTGPVRFLTRELAEATGGRLVGPDTWVDGAGIDSRTIGPAGLFVPILGDRDGHDFVATALAGGAAAYLTARGALPAVSAVSAGPTAVEVADTSLALADIGRLARRRLGDRVVAITGSVGKTSVKDLTAAMLAIRWPTAAAEKSFNNELGVPLTLVNAPEGTEATVVEMGARGRGQIELLCSIASPTIGVVTMVAAAHTALFGTLDDVAAAKGELIDALPAHGTAVLNADDRRVAAMAQRTNAKVVTYGDAGDVRAERLVLDDELRPRFRLASPWGHADVALAVAGSHMATNSLAAAAVGFSLGLSAAEIAAGLAIARLSPWRMQIERARRGGIVLNDAYNANPASMRAAIVALSGLAAQRRVAVVGLMAELGDRSDSEHGAIAALAREAGIELIAVGTDRYGVAPAASFATAVAAVGPVTAGTAVLVKASRVVGLERLAAELVWG